MTETLAAALHSRRLLLILDNCEHLLPACAALAAALLAGCPALRVLATSRQALGLTGETVWPVPSLASGDAARLFAERASSVLPGFALTECNGRLSRKSAADWTVSRWRLNWRRRGCAFCRRSRSRRGWTTGSTC